MDFEGINFVSDIFKENLIYSAGCNCEVRSANFQDIVDDTLVVIVVIGG